VDKGEGEPLTQVLFTLLTSRKFIRWRSDRFSFFIIFIYHLKTSPDTLLMENGKCHMKDFMKDIER